MRAGLAARDRGEFASSPRAHGSLSTGDLERNPDEHPERAYRRGVQQGAFFVVDALEEAGMPDTPLRRELRGYVTQLGFWRYFGRRTLRRCFPRDAAPRLVLKTSNPRS